MSCFCPGRSLEVFELQSLVPENTDYDFPEENWQTVEKKQLKNTQQPVS